MKFWQSVRHREKAARQGKRYDDMPVFVHGFCLCIRFFDPGSSAQCLRPCNRNQVFLSSVRRNRCKKGGILYQCRCNVPSYVPVYECGQAWRGRLSCVYGDGFLSWGLCILGGDAWDDVYSACADKMEDSGCRKRISSYSVFDCRVLRCIITDEKKGDSL